MVKITVRDDDSVGLGRLSQTVFVHDEDGNELVSFVVGDCGLHDPKRRLDIEVWRDEDQLITSFSVPR